MTDYFLSYWQCSLALSRLGRGEQLPEAMSNLQLFAVTDAGPQPLPVPPTAADFTDLYQGLALGVYSVLRTFEHNKFLWLEHHLARTVSSMKLLGWDYQLDEHSLRR